MRNNAAVIQAALEDVDYPRRKEEILDYAKSHNLPEDIMANLQNLSDRVYYSSSDIRDQFQEGRRSGAVRQSVKNDDSSGGKNEE